MRRTKNGSGAAPSEIPDKLYFRIGEVARLCEVPAYVLRFWESEFPQLKPNKGGTGQRLYRRRDVELALRVKTLLKDEGFTIHGARQVLKSELKQKEPQLGLIAGASADTKALRALRSELESIAVLLAKPIGEGNAAQKVTPKAQLDEEKTIRQSHLTSAQAPVEILSTPPESLASAPARPARTSKAAPFAGLLFDLYDPPQNSEGDER
jgi:DNA-binding transcriptional MerR regulator